LAETPAPSPSLSDDPRYDAYERAQTEPVFLPPVPRRRPQRVWLHVLLFLLTVATTTGMGVFHYVSFASDLGTRDVAISGATVLQGLLYSATVLGILGAHEMGHYVACRLYHIEATLPFFIPFPSIFGTLGAVIRIRDAFPTRRALFDVGIAGPIAGFVALLPALFIGLKLSTIVPTPAQMAGWNLGEPMLFRVAARLMLGQIPDGLSLNIHPMVFAAWFGMLATAWNLLPFGQMDGGHISYATFGEISTRLSLATVVGAVGMSLISSSWIAMTLLMLAMLYFLGPRHPRVLYEYEPIGTRRQLLALFALVMLVLCFTPVPMQRIDFVPR
jgi:membrane-associated protease RseP (regulator of RpoE activity)